MSTVYKCKSCGAPLRFDPHTGKLKCDHCDSYFFPYEYHHTRLERRRDFGDEISESTQDVSAGSGMSGPDRSAGMGAGMSEPDRSAGMGSGMPGPDRSAGMGAGIPNEEQTAGETARPGTLALYHCPNCGAEVLTADTAIADNCVYCGYPVAFAGTLDGEFRPDYLLPFEKDKSDAVSGYKEILKSAPFAPKEFREKSALERFRGVYVPVWLYTMDVEAKIDVSGRVEGKKIIGHTKYGPVTQESSEVVSVHEEGIIHYENIARDGLRELDDLIVRCLSPYDYWKRKAFDAGYLAGFYAQRWDVDFDACSEEVRREVLKASVYDIREHACDLGDGYADIRTGGNEMYMEFTQANASRWDGGVSPDEGARAARQSSPQEKFRRTTNRLDPDGGFRVLGHDVLPPNMGTGYEGRIIGERVEYALVPVWLMYTKYQNKDYMFAMNGQTGEIDGRMPVSVLWVLGYLGLTALMVLGIFLLDVWLDGGFMIAGVLPVLWFLNLVRKQSSIGISEKNAEPVRERLYRRLVHEER